MKKIVLVHGWHGTPEDGWFPWLKGELERLSVNVSVPALPNPAFPVCSQWVQKIIEAIGKPNEDVFLVGYSLGVIAILRYLESLPEGERVGGCVLVAGFSESLGIKEHESFFLKPLDYEKVKRSSKVFIAIHSENDPYLPLRDGRIFKEKLSAEIVNVPSAGHFSEEDGFYKLPIVLQELKKMIL